MSTYAYQDVLKQVLQLTPEEQLQLLEDLEAIIRDRARSQPRHTIMEFKGIARELWQGVDVQKYVEEERNSWGG